MKCYSIYDESGNIISNNWISDDQPRPTNAVEGEYDNTKYKVDITTKEIITIEE